MNQAHLSASYYVYLACCANGTLYVGCASDVERRMALHNAGRGGGYTRRHRPLSLVAAWPFNSRAEARQAERDLKHFPPERKLAMAESAVLLAKEEL